MGRFSRLETDGFDNGDKKPGEKRAQPEITRELRFTPDAEGMERADLDQSGCLRMGDEALYRNDRKNAMRWYSRGLDQDSTQPEPWVSLLRVLMLKGDLNEAQSWLTRGLTLIPNSPHLTAMRSVLYARRGMMRQALNNSDAALEQAGGLPLAHMTRGEVLLLAENKNADYCFEQCLKLGASTDCRTPFLIGLLHEERRLWARAIHYYAVAAERSANSPALWYHIGICRNELGQSVAAEKAFEQARDFCEPDDPFLLKLEKLNKTSLLKKFKSMFRKK